MTVFTGTGAANIAFAPTYLEGFSGTTAELEDGINDEFYADGGDDVVQAGSTHDWLFGGEGDDTLKGGGGDDLLDGGYGVDVLKGQDGNDVFAMRLYQFIDHIDGGDGHDTLDLRSITDKSANVDLGRGIYTVYERGTASITSVEEVIATHLADSITGSDDGDELWGMDGDDQLYGGGGGDIIAGGFGDDRIEGGAGGDQVWGMEGNDRIIIRDDEAIDTIDGGLGNDTLDLSAILGVSGTVSLAIGIYNLDNGTIGGDMPIIGVESLIGTRNNDSFVGDTARNSLIGGQGDDLLDGGAGKDVLTGGGDADSMSGGDGRDRFDFNRLADSGISEAARDVITDFQHLRDRLDFSTIDAKANPSGNQDFAFIGSGKFTGEGQIRAYQSGDDTIVEINTSGGGGAEMTISLADFQAGKLTFEDFVL